VKKKFVCLTFDIEEFVPLLEFGKEINPSEMFEVGYYGCKELLKLLSRFNISSTFFITKNFALRFPEIVKKIAKRKNEIGLHTFAKNYKMIAKEKEILEKISGRKVNGIRFHHFLPSSFLINFLKCEDKKEIRYDSSLSPTYVPGRYNNLLSTRNPKIINGIVEIPISVVPLFRLPFSFVWFRILGIDYAKLCTYISIKKSNFLILYFHNWEFFDLSGFDLPFYIKNRTGKFMEKLMEEYIEWCLSKNFQFISITALLHHERLL
jgi:peptidoglycan/xylan/chitin deacetylase (PgdA/CDA1 family)